MPDLLVIFDLDGTLVDSNRLCNQAFLDLIPAIREPVDALVARYRGKRLLEIVEDIEQRYAIELADGFEPAYRQRVAELFTTDLEPMDGVLEMLERLTYPSCIASSGPLEKIRHALGVTGLSAYFDDRLFSAYTIASWKPDPGLFLHAAATMGFAPGHCVVVEDSSVGLEAGAAAGMHTLHYAPESSAPARPGRFSRMVELPDILDDVVASAAWGC